MVGWFGVVSEGGEGLEGEARRAVGDGGGSVWARVNGVLEGVETRTSSSSSSDTV